jgi:hypothetical protein
MADAEKNAEKAARKLAKQRAREAERAARIEREQEDEARYGRQIESQAFGGKIIRVHEKGYVRLGGVFGAAGAYERLLSIEASADVGKKSGVGRGAAAVMTGGINLLGSNKRGDVYLTIVTDKQAYALRMTPPTAGNMTASKALEAAGNAVIASARAQVETATSQGSLAPSSTSARQAGVRERLHELKQLHDEGLIDAGEYERKRVELIDQL